jgi:hypothetical protein
MHNLKNNECDVVTYVLKEPRRCSKCIVHKAWRFPLLCRRGENRHVYQSYWVCFRGNFDFKIIRFYIVTLCIFKVKTLNLMKRFRYFRHRSRYVFPKWLEINVVVTFNVAVVTELCISAAYRISSSGSSFNYDHEIVKTAFWPQILLKKATTRSSNAALSHQTNNMTRILVVCIGAEIREDDNMIHARMIITRDAGVN